MRKKASELKEGDLVDLEHCEHASAETRELGELEYFAVLEIERETDACVCVYFDGATIGLPVDYEVEVKA